LIIFSDYMCFVEYQMLPMYSRYCWLWYNVQC